VENVGLVFVVATKSPKLPNEELAKNGFKQNMTKIINCIGKELFKIPPFPDLMGIIGLKICRYKN
jgi:hypothetical protein